MMDANTIITLVGSLGFPIVACIGIAIFFKQMNDNYRADIKDINSNHRAEMDKITEAINNNTLVIQKLVDKIDKNREREEFYDNLNEGR